MGRLQKRAQNEERQRLESEVEAMETRARHRSLGLMRFTHWGALQAKDAEGLSKTHLYASASCCPPEEAKQRMDQHFRSVNFFIQEAEVSHTVKFLVQVLLELRMNIWVP